MKNKPMWLFLCCCSVPFLFAYIAVSFNWLPDRVTNNGKFVEGEISIAGWQQEPGVLWTIALNAPLHCTRACTHQLNDLTNTYTALGKNKKRVSLAILGRETGDSKMLAYPSLTELEAGKLYLIDHRGLVVLAYDHSFDAQENRMNHKGMLKDLKKLLNYARSS
ncbi:transmembrane cytochrome oxidase associated protein [Pseudoalteromonas aurantia]|uniref:Transmembrane cytochrome oxidase associated protein n=1 Tax=Pseudoalteromonas aurantia 208 TaxID=1314867 RepID=A0ABR9E798_9GAMM|nr:transmembrane cytochrome oxidase associated protein [Pseudoalteromonas aurantia]MBE0366617.1 hypothetical protein [Pseudoalteromonas aurantia 208]